MDLDKLTTPQYLLISHREFAALGIRRSVGKPSLLLFRAVVYYAGCIFAPFTRGIYCVRMIVLQRVCYFHLIPSSAGRQ
jgi:hypothetical protein